MSVGLVILVVVVVVVVVVVLLFNKKHSKTARIMPTATIPTKPMPTGMIPVGTTQVGYFNNANKANCYEISKTKNLDASAIILNLSDSANPSLKLSFQSYDFDAKITGIYTILGNVGGVSGFFFIVELPNDADLLALLKLKEISINPSRLYSLKGYAQIVSGTTTYTIIANNAGLIPITYNNTENIICELIRDKNLPGFSVKAQSIEIYKNISDRLRETLG